MRPRKLTKTLKQEIQRRKEIQLLRRSMNRDHKNSSGSFVMKTSVCAEMYSTKNIPSVDSGKHSTYRNSMMESRFKESPEVRAEIERKSNCLAPAFNKGAHQYITSDEMAKCVGKKNA